MKLCHFCICAKHLSILFSIHTKLADCRKLFTQCVIRKCKSSPFYRVKYFCCMKTEHRNITQICNIFSIDCFTKCMCCIIDHLQMMFFSNLFDLFVVANISINMNRYNCFCFFCDQIFDLIYIHCVICFIDITKYRC